MNSIVKYAVFGTAALAITACGKKGSLVYPDMLVPAAPSVSYLMQSGSGVKMQFVLPDADRAGRKITNLAGVLINKRVSESAPGESCSSCFTDYQLFRRIYLDALPEGAERHGNRLSLMDGEVTQGKLYSYVAVPFARDGVFGASSPQSSVQIVPVVLPPILHVESHPTEIRLSFVGVSPVEGVLVGYNLYRTGLNQPFSYQPVNRVPLDATGYIDSGLARGVVYRYQAKSVVRLPSGTVVEGVVSNVVEGRLTDDE